MTQVVGLQGQERTLIEVSSLLHDVAHSPYSYTSEIVLEGVFKLSQNDKMLEVLRKLLAEAEETCSDFEERHGINFNDLISVFTGKSDLSKLIWSIIQEQSRSR